MPPAPVVAAGPPLVYLAASAAVAVCGITLAVLAGGTPQWAIAAWVLTGPVALGVLAGYMLADTNRRAQPLYSYLPWTVWAYRGALALAVFGVLYSAVRIAEWVGRL